MIPGVILAILVPAFFIMGLESFAGSSGSYFALCAESIMNLVASLTNQLIVGLAIEAGIYGIFMINAGFLLSSYEILKEWFTGWRLFHNIACHKYSLRSLIFNKFKNPKYLINAAGCDILSAPGNEALDPNMPPGDSQMSTAAPGIDDCASVPPVPNDSKMLYSPILHRYRMEDESPGFDTLFVLMYTALIQLILLLVTFFNHTGMC